jgi:hypothetical protein
MSPWHDYGNQGALGQLAEQSVEPDPTATVKWGEQSWDEMMVDHFGVFVDRSVKKILQNVKPAAAQKLAGPEKTTHVTSARI